MAVLEALEGFWRHLVHHRVLKIDGPQVSDALAMPLLGEMLEVFNGCLLS